MPETCIIRTSRSRLPDGSFKSNLGDLLRSTIAVRLFPGAVFVTDATGRELVADFLPPDRILCPDELARLPDPGRVRRLVLLDNHDAGADLAAFTKADFPAFRPTAEGVRPANAWIADLVPYLAAHRETSWQESLVRGLGEDWTGQEYLEAADVVPRWDVGLNFRVHPAWTSKSWPESAWAALEARLGRRYRLSRQQGEHDLRAYKDWIRSCRLIVTCDTLGLHLASAYRRRVVCLAGPTQAREFPYGRVTTLSPRPRTCLPCHAPVCARTDWCMRDMTPEAVAACCVRLLEADAPGHGDVDRSSA